MSDTLGGWIPPDERDTDQAILTNQFDQETPSFTEANGFASASNLPDEAILAKLEIKVLGKPMPRIWQKSGSCLPFHAPVRMGDGTEKQIGEIRVGDSVVTHTGVARKVTGVQSKHTQEHMREIRVRGWADRLKCTDNHLLPKWKGDSIEWAKASDVSPGDWLLIGYATTLGDADDIDVLSYFDGVDFSQITHHKKYSSDVSRTHKRTSAVNDRASHHGIHGKSVVIAKGSRYKGAIPRNIPITAAFARWVGLYLAEGCATDNRVTFTISREETSLADEIVQLTRGVFGIEAKIHNSKARPTSTQVRIGSKTLGVFIKAFAPGVAASKRVPPVFFSCREQIQKALISGWFDGDGYAKMHKKGMRITGVSGSLEMIRDFAHLAASCGIPSATAYRKPRGISKESGCLAMLPEMAREIPSTKLATIPRACGHKTTSAVTRFGLAKRVMSNTSLGVPAEPVFDIEVERDHTFLAWGFVVHNCVGAGGWQAYGQATIGDIAVRGDAEAPDWCFPWATYGMGRNLGGMRGTGEGSFGAAQARAVKEWGMLPLIGNGVPAGRLTDSGWLVWDSRTEIAWSHPSGWPRGAYDELTAVAERNQIQTVSRIRSTDEAASASSQGYGITMASMFGTRNERVVDGFLIGEWNSRWSHQTSNGGYIQHPRLGRIWWNQNQWGPDAHPPCPYMSALGVRGGFWITDATFAKIISSGEVFAHSNTEGFPAREFVWRNPVL